MTTRTFDAAVAGCQPSKSALALILAAFARFFTASSAPVAGSWADGARGF